MNNKNNNEMGWDWRTRVALLLVCALFAAGFGSVGIGAFRSLTAMLHSAWMVRSWQPVPAEVLNNDLRTSSDSESTTYAVQARYRYEWAGQTYESTRVGLTRGKGSDNIDDWHQAWDARLRAARDGGPPVTAWVDPQHPEQAVLDPHLRWRLVMFSLPFALLFPAVAIGALCVAWVTVRGISWDTTPPLTAPRHVPQHNAVGLWVIAIILCVMALPAIGAASTSSAPSWIALIAAVFALAGLALLRMAVQATQRAWTYRGAFASFQPAQPRAGAAFQAAWSVPPRAAAHWPLQTPIQLRVAQYRIDDAGSSSSERLVEELLQHALPHLHPDGGLGVHARFELPADAPSQGARRAGEKVEWRLEWLDAKQDILLAVPIPVQANAAADTAAADRFPAGSQSAKLDIPAGPSDDTMPVLPAGVTLLEQPDALVLRFGQAVWRWFGAAALIALAFAFTRYSLWLEAALLALALHALSRRWTLEVRDDGLLLDRASWLWRHRIGLPASCVGGLYQQLGYSRGSAKQNMTALYALWARGVDRGSDLQLTPSLRGNGPILVAQMLRWACKQRGARFSPGQLRDGPAPLSRPAWGWAVVVLWVVMRSSTT